MANDREEMLEAMKKRIKPRRPFDELFMSEEDRANDKLEKVMILPMEELFDFKNHPFKIQDNEEMDSLVESVIENGILVPLIVRIRKEGGYEIVSGHRRRHAAQIALARNYTRFSKIPCIVKDLTDDEAVILMVDSNIQREKILPSEKAFAYKMKLEAMVHQGKSLTSVPVGQKSQNKFSRDILAEQVGESSTNIQRYIRLTNLIKELLDLVDEGRIALRPAVELSYLSNASQVVLYDIFDFDEVTPSLSQAIRLRKLEKDGELTEDLIREIMDQEKGNTKEKNGIDYKSILKYFPKNYSKEDIFNKVIELLEDYNSRWRNDAKNREEFER